MVRLGLGLTLLLVWGAPGCDDQAHRGQSVAEPGPALVPPLGPALQPFPEATRSLRLTKTVAVRLEPGPTSQQLGTIAQDTRVRWRTRKAAEGCKQAWVEIQPRGWVCGDFLEPSESAVQGVELPRLDPDEVVPGVYGKVVAPGATTFVADKPPPASAAMRVGKPIVGSLNVRRFDEVTVGGRPFWKISLRPPEYVLRTSLKVHQPSTFAGVRLGDDTGWTLPIAFLDRAAATRQQLSGGAAVRKLSARSAVPLLESARDAGGRISAYRIGESEWIDARGLRVVEAATAPARIKKSERWIDIDLDRQVAVAYEGETPVYATLVSTGAKDTPTTPGVYRMWRKVAETDMRDLQSEDPYSVATVPWTQFFSPQDGLALHTAYWHDHFGSPRSHGCINLAPRDARWLYFWSEPFVPAGWTMALGSVEVPGSIVRIRSREQPNPPYRGYAATMVGS